MFDAVANASCYHSTRRPIFEKRQNANVENTWFPIVDRLSLRIFRLVSSCFWYTFQQNSIQSKSDREGNKTEPIHILGKTTFNPIYSFIYQSAVGQSRSEYTFYVDVYGGSILRGFHMTLFIIYLFGCNRVHGNKYLQVSMFEFVSRKMHSTKIDWTCLKCSIAASTNLGKKAVKKKVELSRPTASENGLCGYTVKIAPGYNQSSFSTVS